MFMSLRIAKITLVSSLIIAALNAPARAEDRETLVSVGAGGILNHTSQQGFQGGGQMEAGITTDTIGTLKYDFNADGSLGWLHDRMIGSVQFGQHSYLSDIFGIDSSQQVVVSDSNTRTNLVGLGLRLKDPIGSISLYIDLANYHHDRDLDATASVNQGIRLATRHFLTNELTVDAGAEASFISGMLREATMGPGLEYGHRVTRQIAPGLIQDGPGHYLAGTVGITFRTEDFYISAKGKISASVYAVIETNEDGTTGETKDISRIEKEALLSAGFAF